MTGDKGSWYSTGWDDLDNKETWTPPPGEQGGKKGPKRFWMRGQETRRVMFLDEDPFKIWEHGMRIGEFETCLKRNKIDPDGRCAVCESKYRGQDGKERTRFAAYKGFLSIVDFTKFTIEGKDWQYFRRLYEMRAGSEKKPGILHRFRRFNAEAGGVTGAIVDIYREGDNSSRVGDEFKLVEKVEMRPGEDVMDCIDRYARAAGVSAEQLERHPWTPLDYMDLFEPSSNERLQRLVDSMSGTAGGSRDSDGSGGGGRPSSAEPPPKRDSKYFDGEQDEDIKF